MLGQTLATRPTVAHMIEEYVRAHQLVAEGYAKIHEAQKILGGAFNLDDHTYKRDFNVYPPDRHVGSAQELPKEIELHTRRDAWRRLYHALDIEKIMSIKRTEEVRNRLERDELPELTVENVFELFESLVQNTNEFARESVTEVYDWIRPGDHSYRFQYKTNQKFARFELGRKVILTNVVENHYGTTDKFSVTYNSRPHLVALDRVFHMLDGKSVVLGGYQSPLVDAINTCVDGRGETEYFTFQCYQNSNLHIQFKRLDVLKEFNAVAGGANLKPSAEFQSQPPQPPAYVQVEHAEAPLGKDGFFETQEPVVLRMLELAPLPGQAGMILEPEAGEGAILRVLLDAADQAGKSLIFSYYEKNQERASHIETAFPQITFQGFDFLEHGPFAIYDRIYMNPPFENGQDIDHVMHAYGFLSAGGILVAVMSEGSFYRSDRRATEFRKWLEHVGGSSEKLPEGSFTESGTGVNTRLVLIRK